MASATGTPAHPPDALGGDGADEPLLGQRGDASQEAGAAISYNFVLGTASIAQAGVWILFITIWTCILLAPPYLLFHAHPLLNSAGILLTTQAMLVLQPTHTPNQKTSGTRIHAAFNSAAILSLMAAFIIIEYNKFDHGAPHFTSAHGRMGLVTYIIFLLQAIVGITQYYTPKLYGGEAQAKKIWKYHRMSGYGLLVLSLATICAATQTDFNKTTLHINLWAMIVSILVLLLGLLPRIKKQKLGLD